MVPLHREARDGAKELGFGPVALQIFDRLADEQVGLAAGAVAAEQGDERLLALGAVLADLLAGLLLMPFFVEQVVGDLEGEADVARIAAKLGPALRRNPAHDRTRFEAEADQSPRLQLL